MTKVIAATLLTDRKPDFPVALEYLCHEPLISKVYVNVETRLWKTFTPVVDYLNKADKPFDIDYWELNSSWTVPPAYDQDPARFQPIARGRNLALDWAIVQCMMDQSITHLLFVDSDVRPHKGGLQYLLDLDKPLTGGLVPGRGAHKAINYVFGKKEQVGHIIKCEHGTSGYLLIHRNIFEVLRFRSGPCIYKRDVFLCDDPAFATDAYHARLTDAWYIDTRATADHVGDLKIEEAINDYHNP